MKHSFLKQMTVFVVAIGSLTACEKQIDVDANANREVSQQSKNPVRRAFKAKTQTYFRFAPVLGGDFQPTIIPLSINGTDYWGMSHVPGSGTGSATHMGEVRTYFNQLAYWPVGTTDPSAIPPSGSIAAAVKDVAGYPVILPFPGGQAFPTAADLAILQNVPRMINGKIVNSILVNAKGEAVYTGYKQEGSFTQPLSPTAVRFGGKLDILGGTGKFAKASGVCDYLGQFNPQNQDDAWFNVDGWISY